MSRPKRELQKKFKVFCEGDTEYHYIDEMRRQKKCEIALRPIDMKGGGYTNFLKYLKEDNSSSNCLAKFIPASNEPSAVLARAFGECREGQIPRCSAALQD